VRNNKYVYKGKKIRHRVYSGSEKCSYVHSSRFPLSSLINRCFSNTNKAISLRVLINRLHQLALRVLIATVYPWVYPEFLVQAKTHKPSFIPLKLPNSLKTFGVYKLLQKVYNMKFMKIKTLNPFTILLRKYMFWLQGNHKITNLWSFEAFRIFLLLEKMMNSKA
jgi:hypothetical protein